VPNLAFGRLRPVLDLRWRGWLTPGHRCLVPFNSFAEYAPETNPETKKRDVVWFALNDDRPLCAFAGIWTTFKGDRGTKSTPIPGPHQDPAPFFRGRPSFGRGGIGRGGSALTVRRTPKALKSAITRYR
jgi:hypothetical protein